MTKFNYFIIALHSYQLEKTPYLKLMESETLLSTK